MDPEQVVVGRFAVRDREVDRGSGYASAGSSRPKADELRADVGVAPPTTSERRSEPEADRSKEPLQRAVRVVDGQLEDGQPCRDVRPCCSVRGCPFRGGRVVLDEERRPIRTESRGGCQAPADGRAVRADPFSADRGGKVGAPVAESRHVLVDVVGLDRPGRQPTAGLEGVEGRRTHP